MYKSYEEFIPTCCSVEWIALVLATWSMNIWQINNSNNHSVEIPNSMHGKGEDLMTWFSQREQINNSYEELTQIQCSVKWKA